MITLEADVDQRILVLSFEEKFSGSATIVFGERYKKSHIDGLKSRIIKVIQSSISIRDTKLYPYIDNERLKLFGFDHYNLFEYASDPDRLAVDFNIVEGSIIWKDGEIRISSRSLAFFVFLYIGATDFLQDYEATKSGLSALLQDIQYGYEAAIAEIDLQMYWDQFGNVHERTPSQIPPVDQVATDLIHAIREEDLWKFVHQVSRDKQV